MSPRQAYKSWIAVVVAKPFEPYMDNVSNDPTVSNFKQTIWILFGTIY